MIVKSIVDEDIANYSKVSMFVIFPFCSMKCDIESGKPVCQNSSLASAPNTEVHADDLVERYILNPFTKAMVLGGLEPFDSFDDVVDILKELRSKGCQDDVVIYTGYTEEEASDMVESLQPFYPIVVKYGRFLPDADRRYDDVLDVWLSSDNQYAKRYERID